MTLVVGIDTSSFGFHMVMSEDEALWQEWALSSAKLSDDRLQEVYHRAVEMFSHLPAGAHVFCEEALILPKNINTTRKLVLMTGVLYAAFLAAEPDAFWHWVDVASWRKRVLGKGSGTKDVMKALAKTWVQMNAVPPGTAWESTPESATYDAQPDLYDAHCVCVYGQLVLEDES